ncbi:MAG TPA: hypothetical protein VHR86_02460 [Armatimonadota bacterium]|nr:hypothetical protein [Armatimonadota bacterium]
MPVAQGTGAFLAIWVLNRVVAVLLGLTEERLETTPEEKSE